MFFVSVSTVIAFTCLPNVQAGLFQLIGRVLHIPHLWRLQNIYTKMTRLSNSGIHKQTIEFSACIQEPAQIRRHRPGPQSGAKTVHGIV